MKKKHSLAELAVSAAEPNLRASRGPQPGFSREQIAVTAVKIADAEGMEALSMRRIAAELGSGTASLYRYITKKDELLDMMMDLVLPEAMMALPSGDWRNDLRTIASKSRTMILQHPWLMAISSYRTTLGPNTLRWLEMTLGLLDGRGLDIDEMLVVSNSVFNFAKGYAAGEIAEQEASRRSGLSREQWLNSRAHHTRAIVETGNYPMFARVVKDARAPHDPDAAERGFSLGLDYILDGIELRISAARPNRKRKVMPDSSKRAPGRS